MHLVSVQVDDWVLRAWWQQLLLIRTWKSTRGFSIQAKLDIARICRYIVYVRVCIACSGFGKLYLGLSEPPSGRRFKGAWSQPTKPVHPSRKRHEISLSLFLFLAPTLSLYTPRSTHTHKLYLIFSIQQTSRRKVNSTRAALVLVARATARLEQSS